MSRISTVVSNISVTNIKGFANLCNELKTALKKIRSNNQKAIVNITASVTAELAILTKTIKAVNTGNVQENAGTKRSVVGTSESKLKASLKNSSPIQILINDKNVAVINTSLIKIQDEVQKKYTKALSSYTETNKKVEKLLQELLDKIDSFCEDFRKTYSVTTSTIPTNPILYAKFKENQEKKFIKFKDIVKKLFSNINEKSLKNIMTLEKTALKIVTMLTDKKNKILIKYKKPI